MSRDDYIALRRRYQPESVRLIIVAESPPASGRYFYDPTGAPSEPLFAALMRHLGLSPSTKEEGLREFQRMGGPAFKEVKCMSVWKRWNERRQWGREYRGAPDHQLRCMVFPGNPAKQRWAKRVLWRREKLWGQPIALVALVVGIASLVVAIAR
jgi:hypothetical protein